LRIMGIVWKLGLIEYGKAYELQRRLHGQRIIEEIPDVLLLLEHPPTITIGKSGAVENVLVTKEYLAEKGVSLFFIDRGGDATYHGPGQIVGYPIMDLRRRGKDIRKFVYNIEEAIIRTMGDFSIRAGRDDSHPGVWVNREELAAIGLSVRRWVSMHGFAINVNPDMDHFCLINPCGFFDRRATSMSEILGAALPRDAVLDRLILNFSDVFEYPVETRSILPEISCA
jgi:lipoate-protein ligase B